MQKRIIRASSALILIVMMLMMSAFTASAATSDTENGSQRYAVKRVLSVTGVRDKNLASYRAVPIYIGGTASGYSGRVIGSQVYIPIKKLVESTTSAYASYNASTRTLSVRGGGHSISVSDGAYVLYASDRPIFSYYPTVVLSDGVMYSPIESVIKALGLKLRYSSGIAYVSGTASPLKSASSFYREDEVYWLARIINAESRGESLLGQIAVGSVVMNRVKSSLYPNTIWGVIFDKKYGVQFSPILDGSIYREPNYTSILAAKICLEGFRVSEDVLFFLYPRASTSSWIPNSRTYEFSIGKHDFYS